MEGKCLNVFYPSVSPVFFVSATPLKLLNRIFRNFVVIKDIMYRCAYSPGIFFKIFSKWNILLKQFVRATTLKSPYRILWNFVVLCIFSGISDSFFFLGVTLFWTEKIWPKLSVLLKQFVIATPFKYLTEFLKTL